MAAFGANGHMAATELGSSKGQAAAVLFYHLARLLVWGQVHPELGAADPEFRRLLHGAADVLAKVGKMEGCEPGPPGNGQANSSLGLQGFGTPSAGDQL